MQNKTVILIQELVRAVPDALLQRGPIPRLASTFSAGYDLVAWITEPVTIEHGQRCKIGCGFAIELPPGYEAQIRPRSGLAIEHGITVLNTPGTIDADFRGEICVILYNTDEQPFVVEPGMRIAQMVFGKLPTMKFIETDELTPTARGDKGFGSTERKII